MKKSIIALALSAILSVHVQAKPEDCTVNINTAAASEISGCLDGIGEKKSETIVNYREQNGEFETADDLTKVTGIGKKTVEKNRDKIVIEEEDKSTDDSQSEVEPTEEGSN